MIVLDETTDFDLEPEMRPAFWAAYEALSAGGVGLAQIRATAGTRIVRVMFEQRRQHGMRGMLRIAAGDEHLRETVVNRVLVGQPGEWSSVTRAAVDGAVVAVAHVLAEG